MNIIYTSTHSHFVIYIYGMFTRYRADNFSLQPVVVTLWWVCSRAIGAGEDDCHRQAVGKNNRGEKKEKLTNRPGDMLIISIILSRRRTKIDMQAR